MNDVPTGGWRTVLIGCVKCRLRGRKQTLRGSHLWIVPRQLMLTYIVLAILLGVAPGLGVVAAAVVLDQVADVVVRLDTDPAALLQRIESSSSMIWI